MARTKQTITFPARFTLVAATNPCPCGYLNDPERDCRCSSSSITRYHKKLSGPLLDRIDLFVEVTAAGAREEEICALCCGTIPVGENGDCARHRPIPDLTTDIIAARRIERDRFGSSTFLNAHMTPRDIRETAMLNPDAKHMLNEASKRLRLSMRSYDRVLKVARTIADLQGNEEIMQEHIAEALSFRPREDFFR